MKKYWMSVALVTTVVVVGLGIAGSGCRKKEQAAAGVGTLPEAPSHVTSGVQWLTDWDAAMAQAKKDGKPVVIDFYADWCVWCRRLDATTYRDPKVVGFMTKNVVPLKLDVDASPGRALASQYHVDGLPTIVILSPGGKELGRIPGYMPADSFLESVQRYVSAAH